LSGRVSGRLIDFGREFRSGRPQERKHLVGW
jgi:hypothetical protein